MAGSESIKEVVNQVAIQTSTAVMRAFTGTEAGPKPSTMQNQWETQRGMEGWYCRNRFNLDMPDRHVELLNFKLQVTNILETRAYEISCEERIPVIKNLLDQEGLLLMGTFTQVENEKCKTTKVLFSVLSNIFKLCHNQIIISLQYWRLHRKSNESSLESMDRLWTKEAVWIQGVCQDY